MSKIEIKTPVFPESVISGVLTVWNKKVGDSVRRFDVVANIETDKVVFEVVAAEAGVLTDIYINEQDEVKADAILGIIDTSASSSTAAPVNPVNKPSVDEADTANHLASYSTNTTSEQAVNSNPELDLSDFSPSMRRRLRAMDSNKLEHYLNDPDLFNYGHLTASTGASQVPPIDTKQIKIDPTLTKPIIEKANAIRTFDSEPLSTLRHAISQNLLRVKNRTAMLTTFNEVDLSQLQSIREQFNNDVEAEFGIKLGYMTFFMKSVSRALEHYPIIAAKLIDGQVIKHNTQNIAIAVQTAKGLMAPVIKNVQHLELVEIELGIKELVLKANDGQLEFHEMQDGDFTISNGGIFGSTLSTPLINGDQSAILGMHTIQERPIAVNGQVVIRPMMNLALSYDHCLIDGKDAVSFLMKIKEYIENPIKLTLGL